IQRDAWPRHEHPFPFLGGKMNAKEPLCASCARLGKTCCQFSEIHVTRGDVRRIIQAGHAIGFFEYRTPENTQYLDQSDDPVWMNHVFRPDGTRRVLQHRPGGDCVFLGEKGCLLSLEVRPLICRLHPFAYSAEGIYTELSPGCPEHLLTPPETVLSNLGMSLAPALAWHRMLYEEICDHHDDRFDFRLAV
ncbi:MAG: YkgJ family cysteine cluster protein, partial [Pseudomonadota bacterium]